MNAKEFLSSYGAAKDKIKLNKEIMLRAEENAADPCHPGEARYISEFQDRLYSENEDLYRLVFAAERAVEFCPCSGTEREVLYKRFIFREKWEKIADEMLYSVQHLHRLEKSALLKLKVPAEYR